MKRTDYLSWDAYFMGVALLSAQRSKDAGTQVGACIVNSDHKILSVGYNGMPTGCPDDHMPWEREGAPLETKYFYVCHAELNAIPATSAPRRSSSAGFAKSCICATNTPTLTRRSPQSACLTWRAYGIRSTCRRGRTSLSRCSAQKWQCPKLYSLCMQAQKVKSGFLRLHTFKNGSVSE